MTPDPCKALQKKHVIFFVWDSAVTQHYGSYPAAGGSLDVSCGYLIAMYNSQRAPSRSEVRDGAADWSMKRIWLLWKQAKAEIHMSYSSWVLAEHCGILQISGGREDQRVRQEYFT